MGPELADGRPDFLASASQRKTPPLWGIGLSKDVNGHQRLLPRGWVNSKLQSVLWHSGEAQTAKAQVRKFSAAERAALVKFVAFL
jgi:CxxC motif-containing protein (DUF1111 family)